MFYFIQMKKVLALDILKITMQLLMHVDLKIMKVKVSSGVTLYLKSRQTAEYTYENYCTVNAIVFVSLSNQSCDQGNPTRQYSQTGEHIFLYC